MSLLYDVFTPLSKKCDGCPSYSIASAPIFARSSPTNRYSSITKSMDHGEALGLVLVTLYCGRIVTGCPLHFTPVNMTFRGVWLNSSTSIGVNCSMICAIINSSFRDVALSPCKLAKAIAGSSPIIVFIFSYNFRCFLLNLSLISSSFIMGWQDVRLVDGVSPVGAPSRPLH